MHEEVEPPLTVAVHLDEVVAAPEAADAPPDAVDVAQLAVAAQLRDELPGLGAARGIGDGQGLVVRVAEVAP